MSSSQVSDATGGGFSARSLIKLFLALCLACLGIVLRVGHVHLLPLQALLLFGSSVLAAAFLLAWAAEALQVDISQGLAMAVLAFIAVLPEYAVDLYFAASAAHTPSHAQYAAANMTGSNRLLIGVGWSLVALCSIYATLRGRGQAKVDGTAEQSEPAVTMNAGFGVDLTVLAIATVWSFTMPLFGAIAIWNGAGLLVLFAFYVWRVSSNDEAEPELAGVAQELGSLPKIPRRTSVILILMVAAGTLLAAAEPFAESLIGSGEQLGIDKFLLVQWLAPLASEAPELLVATIFALRGHGAAGMSALLSSKVNQWTLLVGTLPIAYSIALGHVGALVLDARQTEELVLTASQSMLGVSFLLNGRLSGKKAVLLLLLFLVQLPFPQANVRYGLSALYLVLAAVQIVRHRRFIGQHLKLTFGSPKPAVATEGSAL